MSKKGTKCDTIEPRLVNITEAAKLLGVGRNTVYTLIEHGELESIKWRRIHRVTIASIDAWIARQIVSQKFDDHVQAKSMRAHDAEDSRDENERPEKAGKRRRLPVLS